MTRYEQGFLSKCAEYGVPEQLAGRMLKAAQLPPAPAFVNPNGSVTWNPGIDLSGTNAVDITGSGVVDPAKGGYTGRYRLPAGAASVTNSPSATVQEEVVTPGKRGLFGSKPAQTNFVDRPIWGKPTRNVAVGSGSGVLEHPAVFPTAAGQRILDLIAAKQGKKIAPSVFKPAK